MGEVAGRNNISFVVAAGAKLPLLPPHASARGYHHLKWWLHLRTPAADIVPSICWNAAQHIVMTLMVQCRQVAWMAKHHHATGANGLHIRFPPTYILPLTIRTYR